MPTIKVISPGFLTTVQDLGRDGSTHLGVSASGAADSVSLRLGNLLVGNPEAAPALEMTLLGGAFEFESEAVIAFAGSDFDPMLDGQPVPLWTSTQVTANQMIRCSPSRSGARCYLCVRGGINVPQLLGSSSTHLLTGVGGMEGRGLRKGDVLSYNDVADKAIPLRQVPGEIVDRIMERDTIRVTTGPQADLFAEEMVSVFSSSTYKVTEGANRMGLRLVGPPVKRLDMKDMVTEGVSLGAVQVPYDGQPIILFVEHQTTGGYPKIANVIAADLHKVGQLRPRNEIKFEFVSIEKALSLLTESESVISPQSLKPL